jgi:hypothetical protein
VILAAQQLVEKALPQRAPSMRTFQPSELGVQYYVAKALNDEIQRRPPPVADKNR